MSHGLNASTPQGLKASGPVEAFVEGVNRVKHAPWLILGLWLGTIAAALPFAIMLQALIADHLGASLAAQAATAGVNFDWWNEFLAQTSGVGLSFVPAIIGFAAVMDNLSRVVDGYGVPLVVAIAVAGHMLLSLFLIGGVLDRLARDHAISPAGFLHACGVYALRFARLAIVATGAYWLLLGPYHEWLFHGLYPALTAEVTVERTAFIYRLLMYAMFVVPLLALNLVFDYAKVRAVVEDRRSMLGALVASVRFVRRHPGPAIALYALNSALFLLVIGVYFLIAPGAGAGPAAFAIGQLYIVLRVIVRLQFAASQIALFQSRLAHAGYVARPVARWPDSPAVEAIKSLSPS